MGVGVKRRRNDGREVDPVRVKDEPDVVPTTSLRSPTSPYDRTALSKLSVLSRL